MASYSYLNEVPVPRIHKHNAKIVVEDSNYMIEYYRKKLIALGAASPHETEEYGKDWNEYVINEVDSIFEDLQGLFHSAFCAQYIVDNPDLVIDESENQKDDPNQTKFDFYHETI